MEDPFFASIPVAHLVIAAVIVVLTIVIMSKGKAAEAVAVAKKKAAVAEWEAKKAAAEAAAKAKEADVAREKAAAPAAAGPQALVAAAASTPMNYDQYESYCIDWSSRTEWESHSTLEGPDFDRTVWTGKLMLRNLETEMEEDEMQVGRIVATWVDKHTVHGVDLHELLDETAELQELIPLLETIEGEDIGQGTMLYINRIVIDREHRGKGLALWLIAAADKLLNDHMSLSVICPHPLNDNGTVPWDADDAVVVAGRAKLAAYYGRLGFKPWAESSDLLVRWNGSDVPQHRAAMDPSRDVEKELALQRAHLIASWPQFMSENFGEKRKEKETGGAAGAVPGCTACAAGRCEL